MNDSSNASTITEMVLEENTGGGALEMLFVVLVHVLLEDAGFRFNNPCVGVLLQPNLVLTALSCVEVDVHGEIETRLIVVYVRNSQVLRATRVYVYPDMEKAPNVALILCDTSLVKEFPQLPEKEFTINDLEYCTLCGFGTEENSVKLEDFTTVRINRSEMELCNRLGERKEWLCLHFTSKMPCRGDVGAPLICGGALSAIFNPKIAAWAPPTCQDTYGATFTPLYTLVPWIQRVNSTLETSFFVALNTPWTKIGFVVTALTLIVVIYCAIMKYVDWRCCKFEAEGESENEPRVVFARSSSNMSRIIERWGFPENSTMSDRYHEVRK